MDGFAVLMLLSPAFDLKLEKNEFSSEYHSETSTNVSLMEKHLCFQTSPVFQVLGLDFCLTLKSDELSKCLFCSVLKTANNNKQRLNFKRIFIAIC